ncbi:MAG TPA: hypothetical protein VHQ90_25460 [Thermoanaerobaculia bacterium]|nr:hypothetical protein [Thermoanaerobaculia bacterium]
MKNEHVSAGQLARFSKNHATSEERMWLVRHLLSGCEKCSRLAAQVFHLESKEAETLAEGLSSLPTIRSFREAQTKHVEMAAERLSGRSQWAILSTLDPEQRVMSIRSRKELQHWGLYDRMLEASRLARRNVPCEGVEIAVLALQVAQLLSRESYGEQRLALLRSDAWRTIAHAKWMASDFDGGKAAIEEAWAELGCASDQPGPCPELLLDQERRAKLLNIEALLLADLRQWRSAESKLEEALEICREAGNRHLEGKTLATKGFVAAYFEPQRAVALIRAAMRLINSGEEPWLDVSVRHNLAIALVHAGRAGEALDVLNAARYLYRRFDDCHVQLRLLWLEGKILRSFGDLRSAQNIFSHLWEEFRARGLHLAQERVSLDLAWVHAKQDRLDPGPPPLV